MKGYGELTVIDGFTASVSRGEKIALIGRKAAAVCVITRPIRVQ